MISKSEAKTKVKKVIRNSIVITILFTMVAYGCAVYLKFRELDLELQSATDTVQCARNTAESLIKQFTGVKHSVYNLSEKIREYNVNILEIAAKDIEPDLKLANEKAFRDKRAEIDKIRAGITEIGRLNSHILSDIESALEGMKPDGALNPDYFDQCTTTKRDAIKLLGLKNGIFKYYAGTQEKISKFADTATAVYDKVKNANFESSIKKWGEECATFNTQFLENKRKADLLVEEFLTKQNEATKVQVDPQKAEAEKQRLKEMLNKIQSNIDKLESAKCDRKNESRIQILQKQLEELDKMGIKDSNFLAAKAKVESVKQLNNETLEKIEKTRFAIQNFKNEYRLQTEQFSTQINGIKENDNAFLLSKKIGKVSTDMDGLLEKTEKTLSHNNKYIKTINDEIPHSINEIEEAFPSQIQQFWRQRVETLKRHILNDAKTKNIDEKLLSDIEGRIIALKIKTPKHSDEFKAILEKLSKHAKATRSNVMSVKSIESDVDDLSKFTVRDLSSLKEWFPRIKKSEIEIEKLVVRNRAADEYLKCAEELERISLEIFANSPKAKRGFTASNAKMNTNENALQIAYGETAEVEWYFFAPYTNNYGVNVTAKYDVTTDFQTANVDFKFIINDDDKKPACCSLNYAGKKWEKSQINVQLKSGWNKIKLQITHNKSDASHHLNYPLLVKTLDFPEYGIPWYIER